MIAKLNGKKLGRTKGRKYITVKEKQYIPIIERYSRDFQGCLTDIEVMKLCDNKISRNTYYFYKRKLKERYCKMVEEREDGSTK